MKHLLLFLTFPLFSHASPHPGDPCADPKTQARRSFELQEIREADQADRSKWQEKGMEPSAVMADKAAKGDLKRRMRVGEIFGEGCLRSAADFEAAFLVFQHGNTADHAFQAFVWAKKAMDLGAKNMKGEVAMAVDRYLVNSGRKQLFGTQASLPQINGCWCIQPIEDSFPQAQRDEYRGGENAKFTGLNYLKSLNAGKKCPDAYCDTKLEPSPKESVPGFW